MIYFCNDFDNLQLTVINSAGTNMLLTKMNILPILISKVSSRLIHLAVFMLQGTPCKFENFSLRSKLYEKNTLKISHS